MADNTINFFIKLKEDLSTGMKKATASVLSDVDAMKSKLSGGLQSLGGPFEELGDRIEKIPSGLALVGAGAGALVAVGKFALDAAMNVKEMALEYDKLSQKTGASVEFLSTFTNAANDAEVSTETVNAALVKFSKNLYDTKGASANVQQELLAVADTFRSMADGPQKTALAMQLFGKAGAEMIPILNQGRDALLANMQAMADAGRIMDTQTKEAALRLDDAMDKLNGKIDGMKIRLGSALIPILSDMADHLTSSSEAALTVEGRMAAAAKAAGYMQTNVMGVASASGMATGAMNSAASAASRMASAMAGAIGLASRSMSVAAGVQKTTNEFSNTYLHNLAATEQKQKLLAQNTTALTSTYNDYNEENLTTIERGVEITSMMDKLAAAAGGGGGGGGASGAVKKLADEVEELKKRTGELKGMLSGSTDEMKDGEKLQTAFAIATGDLTVQQFEEQQSVKALLEAQKEHKASNEQVLSTVLAMREGIATSADAYAVAGDAGLKFKADQDSVIGTVDAANARLGTMHTKLASLPKDTKLDIKAIVYGTADVSNLKNMVSDLHDRHITITATVSVNGTLPTGGGGSGSSGSTTPKCPPDYYWNGNQCVRDRGTSMFDGTTPTGTGSATKGFGITVQTNIANYGTDPRKVSAYISAGMRQAAHSAAFRAMLGLRP